MLVRQLFEVAEHRPTEAENQLEIVRSIYDLRSELDIVRTQCLANRLGPRRVAREPSRSTTPQTALLVKVRPSQPECQELAKKGMVLKPFAIGIARFQEQAASLDLFEQTPGIHALADRIGYIAVNPFENRRLEEKAANRLRRPIEHALREIARERWVGPRNEPGIECRLTVFRNLCARQQQRNGPARGLLHKRCDRFRGQSPAHERTRFAFRQTQVCRAEPAHNAL